MEFRLLGPMEAISGAGPVEIGPPKQRALLAALLLHPNEIVATDELVEMLWADQPPRTASHSIQLYVSNLRKVLAAENGPTIETRLPGYLLRVDPDSIDAHRFQSLVDGVRSEIGNGHEILTAALKLWRGRPLSDFAYEEFAQPHIRRLEDLWAKAVEDLAESEVARGDAKQVMSLLNELTARQPLAEGPRRLLMLALYRAGRPAEALRAYRSFRQLLGEELGVEPSPELQRLEEQILLQDLVLTLVSAPVDSDDTAEIARPPGRNPYKGLRPFDEADAGDFFGRDELVGQLLDFLRRGQRLLAVVGPSGSGKSSVVRAGLTPRLRNGAVPGSSRWIIVSLMPGRQPFEELEAALHRAAGKRGIALGNGEASLLRAALRLLPEDDSELVVVVDQFEELFTLADEAVTRRFLRNLTTAVEGPHSRIRVILTVRADFYDRPLLYPGFAPLFVRGVATVTPLEAEELEAAVREPALQTGVEVEPALLANIVSDMSDQPGALPLLQFTMTELFDDHRGSSLTLNGYRQIGGIRGGLARRADEIYQGLSAIEQDRARQLFLRLVRVDSHGQSTRRRVLLKEVRALGAGDGVVDEVITSLGAERLLVFDREPATGQATVEVTHEALLTGWPKLKGWIDEHRLDLQRREMLGGAAADWQATERDPEYLLTGSRLTIFEAWRQSTDLQLSLAEETFLLASIAQRLAQAEAISRARRRARWRTSVQVGLAGTAAAAAAFFGPGIIAGLVDPPPEVVLLMASADESLDVIARLQRSGFEQATAEFGIDGEVLVRPFEVAPMEFGARQAERGVKLVIQLLGPEFDQEVTDHYPDTMFVTQDNPFIEAPNLYGFAFADHEGSFLVGAAAAMASKSGEIGFIGGYDIPLIWQFHAGFEAGARYVRPDTIVHFDYLAQEYEGGGWDTPSTAARIASDMYRSGADVIYPAAGYSGMGVYETASAMSEELGRHLWAIGVDDDAYISTQALADEDWHPWDVPAWQPHLLTSMIKRFDRTLYLVVQQYAQGQLQAGRSELTLGDDGVDYSTSGGFVEPYVPRLEEIRTKIIAGEIVVPRCPADRIDLCQELGLAS